MSIHINLGQWNTIFAVPSALVDRHLKLSTEAQLKVLLYLLRHAGEELVASDVAAALGYAEDEVLNAVEFWTQRELLLSDGGELSSKASIQQQDDAPLSPEPTPHKTAASRARRPDSSYVAALLSRDANLSGLLEEAQTALGKPLSPGDTATLVMLYDTFGLPCEVLAMLIHYAVDTGSGNMRAIERMGISWSDKGIYTVDEAEREIVRLSSCDRAWKHVSSLFGIRSVGRPTRSQLEHAVRWTSDWAFSDEMLTEAYERCVDTKGEFNIRYLNGILSRWHEKGIRSLDTLFEYEQQPKKSKNAKKSSSAIYSSKNASYDIKLLEQQSLFDE